MAEQVSSVDTTSEQNERLLGFADAVFAIAMTFLALDLGEVPENLGQAGGESVADYVAESTRAYGVYFGTFLVVAFLWWRHHLIFRYIKRSSKALVWLNVAMLSLVAALPYPAQLLGESDGSAVALLALLVPLILIGVLLWFQWELALRQRLTMPELPWGTVKYVRAQLVSSPATMALAAGLAALSMETDSLLVYRLALGMWVLLVVVAFVNRRIWPVPEQATEVVLDNSGGQWSSSAEIDEAEATRVRTVLTRIRNGSDTDRIKVLTDGVVAIAVTILALQLRPPTATGPITNEVILESLRDVPWSIYFTTFLLASVFWMAHVRIFTRVLGADTVLVWLNLFFLMFISFLPTTSALQASAEVPETMVIYLGSMFFTSLSLSAISIYAMFGKRLSVVAADKDDGISSMIRSIVMAVAFLVVIVAVWVTQNIAWASAVYVVIVLNGRISRSLASRIVQRQQQEPISRGMP